MKVRYYFDPSTDVPHIYNHDVSEAEVEDVLAHSGEDRPGKDGARIAIGRTSGGRVLARNLCSRFGAPKRVRDHGVRATWQTTTGLSQTTSAKDAMKQAKYPKGWNQERVQRVLAHYEAQSEEEIVAEDEAAFDPTHATVMEVPPDLVPAVRQLIAKHKIARGDT